MIEAIEIWWVARAGTNAAETTTLAGSTPGDHILGWRRLWREQASFRIRCRAGRAREAWV